MKYLVILFNLIFCCHIALFKNLPETCKSEIYCYGRLLDDIQLSKLYPDSKTFVDLALKSSPQEVLQAFDNLKKDNVTLTLFEIKTFVDKYFKEGDELEVWNPPDWKSTPSIAKRIKDAKIKKWILELNRIWKTLSRKIKVDVKKNPEHYSLIYVPNGFVIPGGRFRELYYWDTYWIIKGLLLCDMKKTAKGVIFNLLHLVKKVGFVPNGNRVYYSKRSQPPLLTHMVELFFQKTGDLKFLKAALPTLKKEMKWWLKNRSVKVKYERREHTMFRYYAPSRGPRPESYREDIETASICGDNSVCRQDKYTALKSGAESGWDYSSRWFTKNAKRSSDIKDINTGIIIPVDLNAIIQKNFRLIAHYNKLIGNELNEEFEKLARQLQYAIDEVLFDKSVGLWFDYDIKYNKRRKYFYVSIFSPLWTKSYDLNKSEKLSKSVLKCINTIQLQNYPGGIPTSLINTSQQWDMPNAWPPLQSILVQGLNNLGTRDARMLARRLANTYVQSNFKSYSNSCHMYEKYDSTISGGAGGGGEYDVHAGFGWSNGVVLEMINTWPDIKSV